MNYFNLMFTSDKNKSYLSHSEIEKFTKQITRLKNRPIFPERTTGDVAYAGCRKMKQNMFVIASKEICDV